MLDAHWSPNLVLAWMFWVGGAVVVLFDLFVPEADDIGHIGLGLLLAGKVFNDREQLHLLERHQLAAFELGREAALRSIR